MESIRLGRGQPGSRGRVTEAQILEALKKYGEALAAVSNAGDRATFDAAADKLATTAGTLATTLGAFTGAGAAFGPVVTVAVKLGAFMTAQNLEHRRYQALRVAMIEACIPVRTLALAVGLTSDALRRGRADINRETIEIAQRIASGIGPVSERVAAMDAGQQAAASMNTLRVDPIPVSEAFVQTHSGLVVAVANAESQNVEMLRTITRFVGLADELRRATGKLD